MINAERIAELRVLYDEMNSIEIDCGENSCIYTRVPKDERGMRTNGWCRCFRDLAPIQRILVHRALYLARTAFPAVLDQMDKLQAERDEARATATRLKCYRDRWKAVARKKHAIAQWIGATVIALKNES